MPETARGSRFDPSKCVAASGEAQCISASCRKIMEILIMQSPLMKALQSPLTISRLKSQDDLNCKAQYSSFFFRTSALLHFQAPYPYLRFGGGFLPGCDVSALSLSLSSASMATSALRGLYFRPGRTSGEAHAAVLGKRNWPFEDYQACARAYGRRRA